jgi:CheY-like chemotaxis protein
MADDDMVSGGDARSRGRLLLAEDNAVNQRVACLMVERMGFEMPVMDGYEAAAAIRRMEPEGRRLPIIALTASALESDRQRCLAVGMDAHVAKPIQRDALAHALDRFGRSSHPPDRGRRRWRIAQGTLEWRRHYPGRVTRLARRSPSRARRARVRVLTWISRSPRSHISSIAASNALASPARACAARRLA